MKKTISIVLVVIVLLNALGYYGIFLGLHYQNDIAMSEALDADRYDVSKELTLKVPVSIAYMPDQSEFERINGKFEYQGELYRMVKQRYAKDTLTVICVKDTESKKIDQVLTDYVKTFTDKATDKSNSKITFNFLKDYLSATFSIHTVTTGWSAQVIHNSDYGLLIPNFTASIVHPPERA